MNIPEKIIVSAFARLSRPYPTTKIRVTSRSDSIPQSWVTYRHPTDSDGRVIDDGQDGAASFGAESGCSLYLRDAVESASIRVDAIDMGHGLTPLARHSDAGHCRVAGEPDIPLTRNTRLPISHQLQWSCIGARACVRECMVQREPRIDHADRRFAAKDNKLPLGRLGVSISALQRPGRGARC